MDRASARGAPGHCGYSLELHGIHSGDPAGGATQRRVDVSSSHDVLDLVSRPRYHDESMHAIEAAESGGPAMATGI